MTKEQVTDLGFTLRMLARSVRVASLASVDQAGEPFASLVTPAFSADFQALLLLSGLSDHTKHLRATGRAALLVVGEKTEANPQTAPRVTFSCAAAPIDEPALKARYLAIHPYAALYAGFGDFALWRLTPHDAHYVGGFGIARGVAASKFQPDAESCASIAAAEAEILAHCNDHHADALAAIAGTPGAWRMVALDIDGFDLAQGEMVRRIAFPAPVASANAVRAALIHLARANRR
jgi:putative heme iron utilization protein